jgi:methyltransferase (TIGR00027 family)
MFVNLLRGKMTEQLKTDSALASTAYWTASVRALESTRTDSLFYDRWADALAGEIGAAWMAQRTPDSVIPIVLRTRFFDDFLERITSQNGIRQIVLLAAGLDTRAYRLNWPPGVQLFELDQPGILAYKAQIMDSVNAPALCTRLALEVDLTQPWQEDLLAAGFDPHQPSGWLLEGFLFYLPRSSITQILDQVCRLGSPGSWLGFDVINDSMLTHPLAAQWVEMQARSGAPWIGTLDDPAGFLAERGWQAALTQAGEPGANHGRWLYPIIPVEMPGMPHNWFVTAIHVG